MKRVAWMKSKREAMHATKGSDSGLETSIIIQKGVSSGPGTSPHPTIHLQVPAVL